MKGWLIFIFLFGAVRVMGQKSSIHGVVSIQNSKTETGVRKFVSNAEIRDDHDKAQPSLTDLNGYFDLNYVGIASSRQVSFQVKKAGLEVVNIAALKAITDQLDTIQINMALPGQIAEYRKRIYLVGKTAGEKKIEKEVELKNNELSILRKQKQQSSERIAALEATLQTLDLQRNKVDENARDFANRYAPVNLDDQSPAYSKAFRLFEEGELDSALATLEAANPKNAVKMLLKERSKTDSLQKQVDERRISERERIRDITAALRLKADLEVTNLQYDSAAVSYQALIELDSKDYEALINYGDLLDWYNRDREAEASYQRALIVLLRIQDQNPDVYDPFIAGTQNNLALIYEGRNDLKQAFQLLGESLSKYQRLAIKFPEIYKINVVELLINHGGYYQTIGEYEKAIDFEKRALAILHTISKQYPAIYDRYTAITLNNMGVIYELLGQPIDSENCYQEALSMYAKLNMREPGEYDENIAETQQNLGDLYHHANRYEKAELAYITSIHIVQHLYEFNPAVNEPRLAQELNNLGVLYTDENKHELALSYFTQAKEHYKKLSVESPDRYLRALGVLATNMGKLYFDMNLTDSATSSYKNAISYYRKIVNQNFLSFAPELANCIHGLGYIYVQHQKFDEALPLYLEAWEFYSKLSQVNRMKYLEKLAATENVIGLIYRNKKEYGQAEQYCAKAIIKYREIGRIPSLANDHDLAIVLANLANTYRDECKHEKAMTEYSEVLGIYNRLALKSTEYEPYAINLLSIIGDQYLTYNQFEKAILYYQQLLARNQPFVDKRLKDYVHIQASAENAIGDALIKLKKKDEALTHYHSAISLYQKITTADKLDFRNEIGEISHKVGDYMLEQKLLDQSEQSYQLALENFQGLAQEDTIYTKNVIRELNSLGNLYIAKRQIKKATSAFEQASRLIKDNSYDKNERILQLADQYAHFAYLAYSKQQIDSAVSWGSRTITTYESLDSVLFCSNAYVIGVALENQGAYLIAQGNYTAAIPMLRRAISSLTPLSNSDHDNTDPQLATCYTNLGILYLQLNKIADAKLSLLTSLKIWHERPQADLQRFKENVSVELTGLLKLFDVDTVTNDQQISYAKIKVVYSQMANICISTDLIKPTATHIAKRSLHFYNLGFTGNAKSLADISLQVDKDNVSGNLVMVCCLLSEKKTAQAVPFLKKLKELRDEHGNPYTSDYRKFFDGVKYNQHVLTSSSQVQSLFRN